MRRLDRIERLLRHYRRLRDEKAGILAAARLRVAEKQRQQSVLEGEIAEAGAFLVVTEGALVDVPIWRTARAYRARIRAALARCTRELAAAEEQAEMRLHEATEAYRTHRIWEIVKEKVTTAETEEALQQNQRELDDLVQQNRTHVLRTPLTGINRRTAG